MYLTLLNLLCLLSISHISGQITYPNMRWSRCGRDNRGRTVFEMEKSSICWFQQSFPLNMKPRRAWWVTCTAHAMHLSQWHGLCKIYYYYYIYIYIFFFLGGWYVNYFFFLRGHIFFCLKRSPYCQRKKKRFQFQSRAPLCRAHRSGGRLRDPNCGRPSVLLKGQMMSNVNIYLQDSIRVW